MISFMHEQHYKIVSDVFPSIHFFINSLIYCGPDTMAAAERGRGYGATERR